MTRLGGSFAVAIVGALLLWAALAINTVLVIGYELDYLLDGRFPLYPTLPVTPLSLSMIGLPVILLFAVIALAITFVAYRLPVWPALAALWLGAGWVAAGFIAFEFQIDFGTTWTSTEAINAFFYRPYITLPLAAIGTALFVWASRKITKPRHRSFL